MRSNVAVAAVFFTNATFRKYIFGERFHCRCDTFCSSKYNDLFYLIHCLLFRFYVSFLDSG